MVKKSDTDKICYSLANFIWGWFFHHFVTDEIIVFDGRLSGKSLILVKRLKREQQLKISDFIATETNTLGWQVVTY